jgi:hypothetical protein
MADLPCDSTKTNDPYDNPVPASYVPKGKLESPAKVSISEFTGTYDAFENVTGSFSAGDAARVPAPGILTYDPYEDAYADCLVPYPAALPATVMTPFEMRTEPERPPGMFVAPEQAEKCPQAEKDDLAQEQASKAPQDGPQTEKDWVDREKKRQEGLEKMKASEAYANSQDFMSKEAKTIRRPPTPDPANRKIAKREWERQMAAWRVAWRDIDGVRELVENGFDEKPASDAWKRTKKADGAADRDEHLQRAIEKLNGFALIK